MTQKTCNQIDNQIESAALENIIRLIPGYDSTRTADDCRFIPVKAQLAIDFFHECLRHIEGALAGKPFILELWQQAIIANLFGWFRPDNSRRYREAFIMVARKSGKTPMVAGIADYVLFCDDEQGQQNFCAAGDADQAAQLFRYAAGMVREEPELNSRAQIYGDRGGSIRKSIVIPSSNSFLRVISADAKTKHGGNPHLVVIDELHIQPNRDLVDTLETSMASANRKNSLLISITTSDFDRESICNEKYDYACKVRDGIINDNSFLPVIYEARQEDDWTDPEIWKKANPNLGVSVSFDYLERKCQKAREVPAFENTFKRLHLNIKTAQESRWLSLEKWDTCNEDVSVEFLQGKTCFGGLDLSSTTDISALVLVFPIDKKYYILPYFWIPGDNAFLRERKDHVPYETWIRQGLIYSTGGNVIDYDFIREKINQLRDDFKIQEIAVDRWAATQIILQLQGDGFNMVPFGQGYASMSAPTKELEKLIISQAVAHGGNPVLRWMASNVAIEQDAAGNIKPNKQKSNEKIDGIVAAIMAIGRAISQEVYLPSVYDERGVTVI